MKPLALLLLLGLSADAADLKSTNNGIEIAAGSLGSFTLTYPEFEPAHKIIEVKASGSQASVKYEGGAECAISVAKDEVGVSFRAVSSDVKS